MAIYHLHGQFISRGKGQSAVAAAAYRHTCQMEFEREGRTIDFTRKERAVYSEMIIPENSPAWLRKIHENCDHKEQSEFLWNKVEHDFFRSNAKLAREFEGAFPIELSREENIALANDFFKQFTDRGMVVDWAYHDKEGNPHFHAMMTIAPLTEKGFGALKFPVLDEHGQAKRIKTKGGDRIVYEEWAGTKQDFINWREAWAVSVNRHLEKRGIEERIDHRSFAEAGIDLEPTQHLGANVNAMKQRDIHLNRVIENNEIKRRNYEKMRGDPEMVLELVTDKLSVFSRRDIAKTVLPYCDTQEEFNTLFEQVKASPQLLPLRHASYDENGKEIEPEKLTTHNMLQLETDLINRATRMDHRQDYKVNDGYVNAALKRYDFLSEEQVNAVKHVTNSKQIACVIGAAGAGKSTLLTAAREAWEEQGQRVFGLALAGKAAEELEKSSGIKSRTIASLEYALNNDQFEVRKGDVFVLDEAGMVGSKQLANLMRTIETAEAKLVMAGDPKQLQPINAGGAFRAIVERVGYSEVGTIRRQKKDWQKQASMELAHGDMATALAAYKLHDNMHGHKLKTFAVDALAQNAAKDFQQGKDTLCLAHSRKDVGMLNETIRARLLKDQIIDEGQAFKTASGEKEFSTGDRLVFLQNDKRFNVKNGMLGTVQSLNNGFMSVKTDAGEVVRFNAKSYDSVDYGYAVTIHKSQGATVDHVHMLATRSITRNLAYVGMTRHRHSMNMYYGVKSFEGYFNGGMVEAFSRSEKKEVSLDYETTVQYGERRGHNTIKALEKQAERIRGAIDRAKTTFAQIMKSKGEDTESVKATDSKRPKRPKLNPQQVMKERKASRQVKKPDRENRPDKSRKDAAPEIVKRKPKQDVEDWSIEQRIQRQKSKDRKRDR